MSHTEVVDVDKPGGGGATTPTPTPYDPSSSLTMRWIVALTAGVALAIWLVTALMLHFHSTNYRDNLAVSLSDTNGSLAEFLVAWAGDLESTMDFVAGRPDVTDAVATIVDSGFADAASMGELVELLGPVAGNGGHVVVAAPDGTIVLASDGSISAPDPALLSAVAGDPGPAFSVLPPGPGDVTPTGPIPSGVRIWSPVGARGEVVGWLGIEVDVGPLARMLRSATASTDSREVYVFDSEGLLITPSRFESDLVEMGLIEPGETSIGMPIVDPGRNLSTGPVSESDPEGALTLMARSAVAGGSGVDVDGYRDYRGIPVVGAWRWIDELGVGIATEIDRSEAFALSSRTSMVWAIGGAALSILVIVLSFAFALTDRRLRRTGRELLDLTEHLDREVKIRTADLMASQERARVEAAARAELVVAVSHELRTPLTSVIGFSRLLHERADQLDPTSRAFLELLLQGGDELADLVDDLLTSVKLSTNSLEVDSDVVDLAEAARMVVAVWDAAERPRIDVRGEPIEAIGDPARIRQILRNLVSNAIRHGGSHVEVSTERVADRGAVVVADDGPEIDAETRNRMFEIYARGPGVEGLAPSLGIGLSLCRHLASAMGGSIGFERIDGWNRFVLEVPPHIDERVDAAA